MSLRLAYLAAIVSGVLGLSSSGCLFSSDHSSGLCARATAMLIDTGASVDHAAGVDAGYYAKYAAGGHWHLEWTCDTKLSAAGCNFTGTIFVDTPSAGTA